MHPAGAGDTGADRTPPMARPKPKNPEIRYAPFGYCCDRRMKVYSTRTDIENGKRVRLRYWVCLRCSATLQTIFTLGPILESKAAAHRRRHR